MKKERINELLENCYGVGDDGTPEAYEHLIEEALTEAYQAGIDEVVEIINEKKFTGKYKHDGDVYSPNEINAMLDDIIKALQDNK